MRADFENRGMAILRLCAARLGQDIDGEPRRTVVYMRTAIIQVLFRPASVLAKSSGSPELAPAICDNTSADFGTTFVATRETDFSASLLVLSIPDAQSLSPTRG